MVTAIVIIVLTSVVVAEKTIRVREYASNGCDY